MAMYTRSSLRANGEEGEERREGRIGKGFRGLAGATMRSDNEGDEVLELDLDVEAVFSFSVGVCSTERMASWRSVTGARDGS